MRLTLRLEDDLYRVARSMARDEDITISEAVNRLLRRALERRAPKVKIGKSGFPIVHGKRSFTSEDVARIEAGLA